MMQKHLIGKVAEGGRRFLAEKLPDNLEFKLQDYFIRLSGALELHRLALQDKLKGREAELTEDIINATCTVNGCYKEVSESPRSLLFSPPQVTPLWIACWFESWELAVLLLSRGADPNRPAIYSKDGSDHAIHAITPLQLFPVGSLETVKELLKQGARLDRGGQNFVFKCTN